MNYKCTDLIASWNSQLYQQIVDIFPKVKLSAYFDSLIYLTIFYTFESQNKVKLQYTSNLDTGTCPNSVDTATE